MRVECHTGHRGDPEPEAFWLGERRLSVHSIVDRWLSAERKYYKCAADDGNSYILRYTVDEAEWDLAAFTHARREGAVEPDGRATLH